MKRVQYLDRRLRTLVIAPEFLHENVQSILGAGGWDTFRLREDDHSVQRAPQHFGQKDWLVPTGPKCGDQRVEGHTEGWRRLLAGEFDLRRQDEHRLIDNR